MANFRSAYVTTIQPRAIIIRAGTGWRNVDLGTGKTEGLAETGKEQRTRSYKL